MVLRVAVVGAGGVGGWFGAKLANLPSVSLTFVLRDGAHATAILSNGLRVLEPTGSFCVQPVRMLFSEDLLSGATATPEPFDVVIVCVKGYHLQQVVPVIKRLIRPAGGPPTAVLPLLNGMDAITTLVEGLGPESVLGGMTLILSEICEPGVILLRKAPPTIVFGERGSGPGPLARTVALLRAALLQAGSMNVVVPAFEDGGIERFVWEKFVNICPFSAVCAICRASIDQVLAVPRGVRLYESLLAESCAVAQAYGISYPGLFDEEWRGARCADLKRLPAGSSASLSRDIIAGKPSELHDQLGALLRLAAAKAVPTPVFDVVYSSLCVVEAATAEEHIQQNETGSYSLLPHAKSLPLATRLGLSLLVSGCAAALIAARRIYHP